MPNKNKIFSKEELFKLIDEKKTLPPDADDFDKEAMEGLSMITDRKKLDGLNNAIDEVLRSEAAKASRKRNLYVLSAAASLLLIIGLFFLLKEVSFDKKAETLAENTTTAPSSSQIDLPKISDEKMAEEKTRSIPDATVANEKGKEGKAEPVTTVDAVTIISSGETMSAPPAEAAANVQGKQEAAKAENEESENKLDDKAFAGGGKDYKSQLAKEDAPQREAMKKAEEKEKDKTRYETNTVWTSSPSSGAGISSTDQTKTRALEDNRNKNANDGDANAGLVSNNAAPQKLAEVTVEEKQKSVGKSKKSKANKELAKPDTVVTDMLAGYSYFDNKPNSTPVQGGPPQSPVLTGSTSTKQADVPVEEKLVQQVSSEKKSIKHESQPGFAADEQNAGPKTTVRGNKGEGEEFVGGEAALEKFVKGNLKISEPQKSGTIVAEFEVESDGKIDTNTVKITTKISNCNPCSEDVKRMVKKMPKWKPSNEKGASRARKQRVSVDYNSKLGN